uniref:Uncharacterized protein n=1 Tax=viral metagenome TaxID=1070528 RepID=A0A6C0DIP0_9ZZZZ
MFVPHPDFKDILVDIDTHKNVVSRDRVNNYFYYEKEGWCMSEVDTDDTPLTKEEYILYYCKNEDGKIIYNKV